MDLRTETNPEPFDPQDRVGELVAVLLVAGEDADRRTVQRALELTPGQLSRVIQASSGAVPGLLVQEHGDQLRLVTHPDTAASVRRFVQAPSAIRLSGAALETLAVVAYTQPTTRAQIQDARGVNSDGPIATLLQHALIVEAGRADGPGRPTLFEVTAECLTLLGLGSLADLPELRADPPQSDEPRGTVVELAAHKAADPL
ncbi:MAG: segregation and condensation protein [Chloroflexota bacterium]|nr:segregation and condensation protein [Chloroflexota bacterium]